MSSYKHLSLDQRCQIFGLYASGSSYRKIAKKIGVHASTVKREIARNTREHTYHPKQANDLAMTRRRLASKAPRKLTAHVKSLIIDELVKTQASPDQIAGRLETNHNISISHESIYQFIWRDKAAQGDLYTHLRHGKRKYHNRGYKNSGRGMIPNRVGIEERPKIVDEKSRFGDFEVDSIIGLKHLGAIVSIVDRWSKYVHLRLVKGRAAEEVKASICEALATYGIDPANPIIHTITSDNGKEFAKHAEISEELKADFYFARPYHSWERGLNEHTNGLVRQYFPKKTDFHALTEAEVQDVEWRLNNRPRKCLGYATPAEKRAEFLASRGLWHPEKPPDTRLAA